MGKKQLFRILASTLLLISILYSGNVEAYTSVSDGQFQTVTIDGKTFAIVTTNTSLSSSITINSDLIIAKDVTLTTTVGSTTTVNGNVYIYGYVNNNGNMYINGTLKIHNLNNFMTSGSGSQFGKFLNTGYLNSTNMIVLNSKYIDIPLELLGYNSITKILSGAILPVGTVKINNTIVGTDVNGVFNYNLGDPVNIIVSITDVFGFENTYSIASDFIMSLDPYAQSIKVTGVALNKNSVTLAAIGSTEQLSFTISPSDATNKEVTWTSSDETVATVSSTGIVNAVGYGNATITVKTVDGNYQTTSGVNVAIPINVTGIILNKNSVTLAAIGSTEQLSFTISPSDATNKEVTWTSSDETVATVSSTGIVNAVGYGNATITLTTVEGGYQAAADVTIIPTSIQKIIQISSGFLGNSLILFEDGNVFTLNEITGQTKKIEELSNISFISAGANNIAISKNGQVYIQGYNDRGQFGLGYINGINGNDWVRNPFITGAVSAASSYSSHNLILTSDGKVWGMGDNSQHQIVSDETDTILYPVQLNIPEKIIKIEVASNHNLALSDSGNVYYIGYDGIKKIDLPSKVISIAAAGWHSLILLDNGDAYSFGENRLGQLGVGDYLSRQLPERVLGLPPIIAITAGNQHSVFLSENGDVYSVGHNFYNQIGMSNEVHFSSSPIKIPYISNAIEISAGSGTTIIRTSLNELFILGGEQGQTTGKISSFRNNLAKFENIYDLINFSYIVNVPPVVLGVENEKTYNSISFMWDKGEATLNGVKSTSGYMYLEVEGEYTLIVTDLAGNSTTVMFTISKVPPIFLYFSKNLGKGILSASKNNLTLEPGTVILKGSSIVFNSTNNLGYKVSAWLVNGQILNNNGTSTYLLENINTSTTVEVRYCLIGDINGDNQLSTTDLVKIRRALAGLEDLSDYGNNAADMNEDNAVTTTDLVKMRRKLAGLE